MTDKPFDVLIVGAGTVGSMLAAHLARRVGPQWRIGLVEPASAATTGTREAFDARVVALTEASQQNFAELGLWQSMAARACPYRQMQVWDGEGNGAISFDSHALQRPALGYIVEHRELQKALAEHLVDAPIERISDKVTALNYNAAGTQVTGVNLASGQQLSAQLVVAADGAQSSLRQLAGFSLRQWSYGQKAIVTTVKTAEPHGFTARQRFMASGPLAFLPLQLNANDGAARHCSIVWSADEALADELMALDDNSFCQRLGASFEHRLGQIEHVAKRHAIALHQRHATRYILPGLALVGDAAHSIHPLAGQGVNLGLCDVACLAQELARAHSRQLPASEFATLKRYQRQRMGHNLAMMTAMEGFKQLFGSRRLAALWLRNRALDSVDSLPALKNTLARQAMGLSL